MVRALASHLCGPGSIPRLSVILKSGLSLLLALVLAPRGFSPGTPVFTSPQNDNICKFQFDLGYCQALYHDPLAREIAQTSPVFLTLKLLYFYLAILKVKNRKRFDYVKTPETERYGRNFVSTKRITIITKVV